MVQSSPSIFLLDYLKHLHDHELMNTLLIIDDEVGIQRTISTVLTSDTLRVITASNENQAIQALKTERPSVVLLDLRLGKESGWDVFNKLKAVDPKILIIFITGHGNSDTAIESMKLGAFDYLVKPLDIDQLCQVVSQAFKIAKMMRAPAEMGSQDIDDSGSDRLIGNGAAMQSICKQIGRIAPQDINVLVLGESGTGKELIARAIYQHSRRSNQPYLAINCAAIPEPLLESELFGHEKGAFTGADKQRIGKFEQCHGGTIFLDEIGDMPIATQAKILRLLQDGQFQRVGGNQTIQVDVRVIAATHQNLDRMIEAGSFRGDLFYRLRGVTLQLPPLRSRIDDIAELSHYFLFRFNRQLGTNIQTIAPECLEALRSYSWPGNIRELQAVLREAVIVSTGPTLLAEFLSINLSSPLSDSLEPEATPLVVDVNTWQDLGQFIEHSLRNESGNIYRMSIERFDSILISFAMNYCNQNLGKTCELLGISRPTLNSKIRSLVASRDQASNSSKEITGGIPN